MKRIVAWILMMAVLLSCAMAEFDTAALKQEPDMYAFTQHGTVNTVYRRVNQPYIGQLDEAYEGELVAYVDYITLVDAEVTLLRLLVSTVAFDQALNADELRLTVGGKCYTLAVGHEESEYDGMYMEDYSTCLTDASLPLLKAIAQQKQDDPIPVELLCMGDVVFSGLVIIPGEEAAWLYDTFVDLGGKTQSLKQLDELYPCKVEKVK